MALDMQHMGKISDTITQLMHLTSAGSFKAVGVNWSAELDQVVVWYYDVEMVADLEIDEDEMNLARKTGIDLAPLERSSTCEVRRWIKASKGARK
jgi:hypothetical protein